MVEYPTSEKIVEFNILALSIIKVKKADQPKLINTYAIPLILKGCQELKGDVYDKAIFLLKGIIQHHPFASGNRRTAFIVTKDFLTLNGLPWKIPDEPGQARALQGVRENYYSIEEIRGWLKNGKIRTFER
ncbi:Fic family protein [Candidatus Woesearchaeota archaeon]|nr:Fic family protein [Candidatus Woesearchaeota archaeon]